MCDVHDMHAGAQSTWYGSRPRCVLCGCLIAGRRGFRSTACRATRPTAGSRSVSSRETSNSSCGQIRGPLLPSCCSCVNGGVLFLESWMKHSRFPNSTPRVPTTSSIVDIVPDRSSGARIAHRGSHRHRRRGVRAHRRAGPSIRLAARRGATRRRQCRRTRTRRRQTRNPRGG